MAPVQQLELHVTGMTCGACENRIQGALARLPGVVRSMANHRAGRVDVVFDPGRTSSADIQARIAQAGYEVIR